MPTLAAIHTIGPVNAESVIIPPGGTYLLIGKIANGSSQSPYMCVKSGGMHYGNIHALFKGWTSSDTFAWKIS